MRNERVLFESCPEGHEEVNHDDAEAAVWGPEQEGEERFWNAKPCSSVHEPPDFNNKNDTHSPSSLSDSGTFVPLVAGGLSARVEWPFTDPREEVGDLLRWLSFLFGESYGRTSRRECP